MLGKSIAVAYTLRYSSLRVEFVNKNRYIRVCLVSEEGTQGGRGGQGSSKKRDTPWARAGMCWAHYKFGEAATTCQQPCNRAEN